MVAAGGDARACGRRAACNPRARGPQAGLPASKARGGSYGWGNADARAAAHQAEVCDVACRVHSAHEPAKVAGDAQQVARRVVLAAPHPPAQQAGPALVAQRGGVCRRAATTQAGSLVSSQEAGGGS